MPGFAARLGRVQISAAIAMSQKARAMRAAGIDVLSLAIGEPDFASPPEAVEAAHRAALRGETKYPPVDGTVALKQAIQRKFRRDSGLDYGLDEIMVANGGKQVIYNAVMATVDAGDEVVIPAPYWAAYALVTQLAGGTPVFVNCPQNNGFRLRPEDLDAAITPRTKWLILNFPNNPTGAACSRAQMRALGEVMLRYPHVWIMCDDMYEHLIYDSFDYLTMAAAEPGLRDRTLTLSGVSKTYAMTGWRVGFCGGPKDLIRAMANMQSQATSGISTVGQAAAGAALDGPQEGVAARAAIYRRRRDLVVDALNAVPGINCHRPEGAFYVYPNVAGCLGKTTAGGVTLTEACRRIAAFCAALE
jgi:aspartate aminotransferase